MPDTLKFQANSIISNIFTGIDFDMDKVNYSPKRFKGGNDSQNNHTQFNDRT